MGEIQKTETAIHRFHQATTGTQTEKKDSLQDSETLNLKETLSENVPSNTPIETSFGLTQPKDIRVRRKGQRKANPEIPVKATCTESDLWTRTALHAGYLEIVSSSESRHLCQRCRPPRAGGSGLACPYLAAVQDKDPDLQFIKELLRDHDVRPQWDIVREESAEVKIQWTQFHRLKTQENVLYRRRKETAANPQWQVVAAKPLRSQIFKACHHHAMAAHQGVVRTPALIKRRFYWPRMQKDVEAWCKRCTACGRCKTTVRGHSELQQPKHGAFNERVSVNLI